MSHAYENSTTSLIARAFVSARRSGRKLETYPGSPPGSLESAYAIQDEAIAEWPDRIAGWKLGRILPPYDTRLGAGRLAGPIFSRNVWDSSHTPTRFGVIEGGFAAVEAEYVLEVGETPPDRGDWTVDAVAPLVSRAFIGVEIAGSPFAGINKLGPTVTVSDFGNNAGLILGQEIVGWRERLSALTCTMAIDDIIVGQGGATLIPSGPLASLAFLLNLLHRRGRRLTDGQLISTGAATGVHDIRIGQSAFADFGPDGYINCLAVPATEVPV